MPTITLNEHGALLVDDYVVGWVRHDDNARHEHDSWARAIAVGYVWHVIPRVGTVEDLDRHHVTLGDAINALLAHTEETLVTT